MNTPTKQKVERGTPRNPQVISGSIRQRVEWLLKRNIGLDEQASANWSDVHRIDQLLDELDSALLEQQLTASLGGKR